MPIYEFHCAHCKKDSEILVRSSKWEGTACPRCGSTKLAKKLSVFAASSSGGDLGCDNCPDTCCDTRGSKGAHPCGSACRCH